MNYLRTPSRDKPSAVRATSAIERCRLGRLDCPYRAACARDAPILARARAGSRADFDALYDRYFALVHRAASQRFGSRALAEACTRGLLKRTFGSRIPPNGCTGMRLLRLVERLARREERRANAWRRLGVH